MKETQRFSLACLALLFAASLQLWGWPAGLVLGMQNKWQLGDAFPSLATAGVRSFLLPFIREGSIREPYCLYLGKTSKCRCLIYLKKASSNRLLKNKGRGGGGRCTSIITRVNHLILTPFALLKVKCTHKKWDNIRDRVNLGYREAAVTNVDVFPVSLWLWQFNFRWLNGSLIA